jgi:hypothetical protein
MKWFNTKNRVSMAAQAFAGVETSAPVSANRWNCYWGGPDAEQSGRGIFGVQTLRAQSERTMCAHLGTPLAARCC